MNGIPGDLHLKAPRPHSRPASAEPRPGAEGTASPSDPVDSAPASATASAKKRHSKSSDAEQTGEKAVSRQDILRMLGGEVDLSDLEPPTGPVADLYADLGKAGHSTSEAQVRHAMENFEEHREALVTFKEKPGRVYSFASVDELQSFVQGRQDATKLPDGTRQLHEDLSALEDRGASLMFGRKATFSTEWLDTDAAGATILLQRGEQVVALDRYGEVVKLDKPAEATALRDAPPVPDATRDEVVTILKALEERGFQVAPEEVLPEDLKVTDIVGMAKHKISDTVRGMLTNDPTHDPLQQKRLAIDALASNGVITLAPPASAGTPEDEDGPEPGALDLPSARPLDLAQLRDVAAILDGRPTPVQQQFFDDMKTLRETRKPHVFSRETASVDRGALHKANDLVAWLNMKAGGEIVLLNTDGTLAHLDSPDQVHEYVATGKVTHPAAPPVDPDAPKTNLLMLYYDAPFDPAQKGGIYEDTPLRAASVGSNAQLDLVTLRSDLPQKQNLRSEYLQPEDMQLIQKLDPATLMNNPQTLENFVYQSLKAHPDDKHYRLMVAGHGGAELGLLPDGDENNASAHGAMSVDDFADAVHRGLGRFNQETGQERKIDNLVVGSCLMGNTSFIHALAKRGDICVLSASPETLMGNDPNVIFQYLADPKTADRSAQEFASDMVELLEGASAFPGGRKNLQFADTFGAYDLSPDKGKKLEDSLSRLFQAVLDAPQNAKYVKEDIAACATYGVNRILNFQLGINQRDVIEVAERILGDARIKTDEIKAAAREVVASTESVVLKQKMSERYSSRRGPTLYLPIEPFAVDQRLMQTSLLKSTKFAEFTKLVTEQPVNRSLLDSLGYEIDRVMSGMRKAGREDHAPKPGPAGSQPAPGTSGTPQDSDADEAQQTPDSSKTAHVRGADEAQQAKGKAGASGKGDVAEAEAEDVQADEAEGSSGARQAPGKGLMAALREARADDQEIRALAKLEKTYRPWYSNVYRYAIATPLVMAATAAGAVAGAALGAVILTPVGTLLGLHAGLTGRSVAQRMVDGSHDPSQDAPQPASGSASPSGSASSTPSRDSRSGASSRSPAPSPGLPTDPDSLLGSMAGPVARLATQAALSPMELGGELINRSASYHWGNGVGRAAGATLGTVSGAAGGSLAGILAGGLAGGLAARGISRAILRVND